MDVWLTFTEGDYGCAGTFIEAFSSNESAVASIPEDQRKLGPRKYPGDEASTMYGLWTVEKREVKS